MRVPWSWLAEWVELAGTPGELCQRLTFAGVECEVASDARQSWPGVITARLDSVVPHPNAERLTVTAPFDGSGTRQVVCGAKNHRPGDIVALATVGTVLPGDFKIQKSKIRGELSEGMLCSERELGLSEESEGILILPPGTALGVPLHDVVQRGEVILEVSPTANRGDCLSIAGLAREVAAVTGWALRPRADEPAGPSDSGAETVRLALGHDPGVEGAVGSGERQVLVTIAAPERCRRYACAVLTGLRVGPSPKWLRDRLEAAGQRPINNVVDATNYVMLELGNPLHAFDLALLGGSRIEVRLAEPGETLKTLDGRTAVLENGDLVIAGERGPLALAGIMGGEESGVSEETTDLLLESASFEAEFVRRTAARTKMTSESSTRFSRGVDPELPRIALLRLAAMLHEIGGATWVGSALDLRAPQDAPPPVLLRSERVAQVLGSAVPHEEIVTILGRLGARIEAGAQGFEVWPPSARTDLSREIDLIEEIARIRGYDLIEEQRPARPLRAVPRRASGPDWGAVAHEVAGAGLSEAIGFSFIDERWLEWLGYGPESEVRTSLVRILNPLSEVGAVLRPLLLPSLVAAAARNRAAGVADVRLFELRPTFVVSPGGPKPGLSRVPEGTAAVERKHLAYVLIGRRAPPSWAQPAQMVDFFDSKAVLESVELATGAPPLRWEPLSDESAARWPFLDRRVSAQVGGQGKGQVLGFVGCLQVGVLRAFGLDAPCWVAELDVSAWVPSRRRPARHRPVSRFPGSERDLALLVPAAVSASSVVDVCARAAKKSLGDSVQGVEVFDVFTGKDFPTGTRSLALRFRFRSVERTLADAEIDAAMATVERKICERDGVTVRR